MAESPSESDAIEASAESSQDLVEDVLREAQALLATPDAPKPETTPVSDESASESAEAVDVEGLVARVDSLLGDLGHLVEDVESVEESGSAAGLDLTLVLPTTSPSTEDLVPDHGSAGPQVDLFATPEEPVPTPETSSAKPEVVLEMESSPVVDPPDSSSDPTAMLDDLSAALAEEFDQPSTDIPTATEDQTTPEAVGSSKPDIVSETEDALLDAMAEEFGQQPTELPPLEDEGDPFESAPPTPSEPSDAARRLEALLADRLAEEFELVEQAASTTPKVIESQVEKVQEVQLVQSDVDAVARAEMEALEALGSQIDTEVAHSGREDRPEESIERPDDPTDMARQPDPSVAGDEDFANPEAATPKDETPEVETPKAETAEAGTNESSTALAEDGFESEDPTDGVQDVDDSPVDPASATESDDVPEIAIATESPIERPRPEDARRSALIRLGAAPFRFVPRSLHRYATPVALSLVAWVPLAWGYAILSPDPEPPMIDVLRAGFQVDQAEGLSDAPSASSGAIDDESSAEVSSTVGSASEGRTPDPAGRVRP